MRDGETMDGFSASAVHAALDAKCQAERLARVTWWHLRRGGSIPVLPRWTAWLLMRRAGIPLELIAHVCETDARYIRRRLTAAAALMLWPPYGARIEALMRNMPRFGAAELPELKPAKEAACVAQTG
jgi:hypothetical protein